MGYRVFRPGSLAQRLCALCVLLLLGACQTTLVSDEIRRDLRAGEFERGISMLEAEAAKKPGNPELRSALQLAREEAINRLMVAANAERNLNRFDQAEAFAKRVLVISPRNDRALAFLIEVDRDRRLTVLTDQIRALIEKDDTAGALRVVREALVESPRSRPFLALQRQLELDLRRRGDGLGVRLAQSRPISMEFREADLRMVLEALSRDSRVNFMVDKDVRPDLRITVFLRETPFEDAIDLILATNQLSKKVLDPNTVMIYPNTPEKNREYQDLVVRSFFLSNADAKQTAALLRSVLKIREPFVDERINMLVVRETPELVQLAERLVALYDQGEPEVMLEVELLEVNASRLTELGIRFPDQVALTVLPPAGSSGLTLGDLQNINRDSIGISSLGVLINLKREVGDFTILANPRIRAKNKEKARIQVGDRLPVVTTTATSTGFVSESIQYVDTGIKVEFEPSITLDDEVTIKVGLEASNLVREIRTSAGGLAYQIGTRNATTVLKLKDGETQILGGLISNSDRNSSARLPGLGDVPGVGKLFSSNRAEGSRTEIILAITPRILRNVQRPNAALAEFYSGSEAVVRARPLMSAGTAPTQRRPDGAPAAAGGSPAPAGARLPGSIGSPSAPATPITLRAQAPATAKVGETVTFDVAVSAAVPLRGLVLDLDFDATRLELLEAAPGDFLKQGDATVTPSRSGDAGAGKVTLGALRARADGAAGEGALMAVKFKAKAAGPASVRVGNVRPLGAGQPLGGVTPPAPVTILIE